jgi:integrase
LKALPEADKANNVVLAEEQAQAWVAEAYALDHALGLLTHVIAETGARPSQVVRLLVRDLIAGEAPRLMMPKSGKGGTRAPAKRKAERYPVSISPGLAVLLRTAVKGRQGGEHLLLRSNSRPWNQTDPNVDYARDVDRVVVTLGLDPAVYGLYAFRHTSITRMLLKGIPTAIVAQAHDTGEAPIRKHYAASILNHTDDLTRQALPALGPAQLAASNVVQITKR